MLKKYQAPINEAANNHARWFCAVRSPMIYGSFELGDVYCHTDVRRYARKVYSVVPGEEMCEEGFELKADLHERCEMRAR